MKTLPFFWKALQKGVLADCNFPKYFLFHHILSLKKNLKIILPLFLICWFPVNAQEDIAKTSFYLEILGNGGAYSLNVERKLSSNFYGRVGFGSWTAGDFWGGGETSIFTFPVMGSMLFGKGSHKLEIGAGFLFGRYSYESNFGRENDRKNTILSLTGVAGYRFQKPAGGFMARVGLTPLLDLTGDENAYPDSGLFLSGGLSVGYSF